MGKSKESTKTDFSSFMCVIIMLTGALITVMIANIMIISANPDNITISSVMGISDFADGNEAKEANYIDVHRDRFEIYFERGNRKEVVPLSELETRGNPLEIFMNEIKATRDTEYIVLLIRPGAAEVYRRLVRAIQAENIDIGIELFNADQRVFFKDGLVAEQ
ncbi:MAG TPA: hypothetical protein PKE55_09095 [Kiritimatiellia bacterium]|nr:hypothetical protein [Kiritimatiellia bacterium]